MAHYSPKATRRLSSKATITSPPTAINRQYFTENNTHTVCHWKGVASYYDLVVDGKVNSSAAWYYPEPKAAAGQIKDYVAFWRGVQVMA